MDSLWTGQRVELFISLYDGTPSELEAKHVNQKGVTYRIWEPQPIADQVKIEYWFANEADKLAFIEALTPIAKEWMRK